MFAKAPTAFVVVALLALVIPNASRAQIAGFKISPPMVGNTTTTGEDATFDVLAYGNTTGLTSGAQQLAGTVLNNSSATSFVNSYSFGQGLRPYLVQLFVNSQWNWGDYPAISYGDGQLRQVMALALDPLSGAPVPGREVAPEGLPLNTFRGTFTHTYTPGNYVIKARLTPDDDYPLVSPGVDTAGTLSTGFASVGSLHNTFIYKVTVSALSPPGSGTYFYNNTVTTTHDFPTTVRQVWNTEKVEIGGFGPTLSVVGSCPGMATIDITGLTPNARVTFWASNVAGATPIGAGPCATVNVDLDTTEPRQRGFADELGTFSFSRFFVLGQCGVMMQAVNHGTCTKSSVVTGVTPAPVAPPADDRGPAGGLSLGSLR